MNLNCVVGVVDLFVRIILLVIVNNWLLRMIDEIVYVKLNLNCSWVVKCFEWLVGFGFSFLIVIVLKLISD